MPANYADFDCPKCGAQVYDNTENKRNPRAPDFKCSDKDCDYVKWPPRGNNSRGSAPPPRRQAAPAAAPARPASSSDDRSARIERQHSQEMALRYFALQSPIDELPPAAKLREMISWFQRDIGTSPAMPPRQQQRQPDPEPEPEPTGDPTNYGDGAPVEEDNPF